MKKNTIDNGLVVRDCKEERNSGTDQGVGIGGWICGMIFMIIPVLGFLVSMITSIAVSKDRAYKNFARFCLSVHMLVSLAAAYLYFSGTINVDMIKSFINRF